MPKIRELPQVEWWQIVVEVQGISVSTIGGFMES